MGLFFQKNSVPTGRRLTGFPRYAELISRDFKLFLGANLLTLFFLLPFLIGLSISLMSTSILLLIPTCLIGGAIAGPAIASLCDITLRSLRDTPGLCLAHYKKAWKQNWKQSVVPGILLFTLIGADTFMIMMLWISKRPVGFGTIGIFLCGLILMLMFFSTFWSQVVLFQQSGLQSARNSLFFMIRYFWKVLGCAILKILYWGCILLFMPVSSILVPFFGLWFIEFSVNFLLYNALNTTFRIEEQIAENFPEQVPFYEDDQEWLKRKQNEQRRPPSES